MGIVEEDVFVFRGRMGENIGYGKLKGREEEIGEGGRGGDLE